MAAAGPVRDGDPAVLLPALGRLPHAALMTVPDPVRPLTVVAAGPHVELRIDAAGTARRSDGRPVPADPLAAIAAFVAEGDPAPTTPALPLAGAAIGYLAYELGAWCGPRVAPRDPGVPVAVLRRYATSVAIERRSGRRHVYGPAADWVDAFESAAAAAWLADQPLGTTPLVPSWPRAAHAAAVARLHEHLLAGDVYQANLTLPFTATTDAPAWALAARLAAAHPVPYVAYLDLGDTQIVGNTPELFLRVRDRSVETRPIKGTRRRDPDAARDAALAAELAADEKERAEHVMIVDLERNDLGRVCATGSVHVPELMAVETHPTVHHLVSSVRGTLRADVGLDALLRATFPGGSITGAPKERAMQILAGIEPVPRGVYCGALGLFSASGDLELALAIRTAVVADGVVRWHAGGGIVVDSDPEREWTEAWLKTAALRRALGEPADRPPPA